MRRSHILILLFLGFAAVRVTAPPDLFTGDQEKQVGYVMDILHGGGLAVQYEVNGQVATKPPLYNWLAAWACLVLGNTRPWVMKLPALAAAGVLLALLYGIGRRLLDEDAAFWAVLAAMAAHHVSKLAWFARTDMLMACTVHLAVWMTLACPAAPYRAPLLGLVTGLSFLAKGPVGPCLIGVWLLAWGWHVGALRRPRAWLEAGLGTLVLVAIAGVWLLYVWDQPQFQQTVVNRELGQRLTGAHENVRPFYYYIPLLFARIAPWPVLAVAAVVLARRRHEESWPAVRLVAWWAGAFFVYFSLLPGKRHDLLLPVYPAVFLLAGYGMRYLWEPAARRWLILALRVLPGLLTATALGVAIVGPAEVVRLPATGYAVVAGMAACGAAALAAQRRERWPEALVLVLAGLVVAEGLVFHGVGTGERVQTYRQLQAFVAPVRAAAGRGQVFVCGAHPLVSYELGLHQRELRVEDALRQCPAPGWILSGAEIAPATAERHRRGLVEEQRLVLPGTALDVRRYRVERLPE